MILITMKFILLFLFFATIILAAKIASLQNQLTEKEEKLKHIEQKNKNLIYSLNHDFKVALLAQQRAFEILPKLDKTEQEEILKDLSDSNKYSIDMLNMLSTIHELKHFVNLDLFDFNELVQQCMKRNLDFFENKSIKTSIEINKKKSLVKADKKSITKVIEILLELTATNAKRQENFEIKTIRNETKTEFSITFKPQKDVNLISKTILDESPQYTTVGQGIKNQFVNKILSLHNSKIKAIACFDDACKISFSI